MISSIDLTAACRVHLMEPQWNPMAEEQALDRVHRIGQTQPVVATRYIVSESVEEVRIPYTSLTNLPLLITSSEQYVVSLQKKKLDLIQQSLGPNAAPKSNALRERLKVRCLRYPYIAVPLADDGQSLHDFLASSSIHAPAK